VTKARDSINGLVKLAIAPMLKSRGFKKSALNFARRSGAVVHFVNVQLSSWNSGAVGSFYLNVGVAFDEIAQHLGKSSSVFPRQDDCQFLVRIEKLNPKLPQQFVVDEGVDLGSLGSSVALVLDESFVSPLTGVDSLHSFGKTGWVNVIPWGFPALFHYLTGDHQVARWLIQREADYFADRGLTFESVAKHLRLQFGESAA
jgi:Domain of unknown function (DUF4304)